MKVKTELHPSLKHSSKDNHYVIGHITLRYRDRNMNKLQMLNHRTKLLRIGFSEFRKFLKIMRKQTADQKRYTQLTNWGWNVWLPRSENKEELRMLPSHIRLGYIAATVRERRCSLLHASDATV